jgi:hypothetical protein
VLALALSPAGAGEEVMVDGVPHIRNGREPSQGIETLDLRELWRAGGPEDEETLFGLVSDVGGDADGNTYVMDAQLCQVHVYAPDGRLLRTLFREGEGPGEVQDPRDMVMLGDGTVGLVQEFPGKIVLVDRMGSPKGSILAGTEDPTEGGWVSLVTATCRGDHLICTGEHPRPTDRPNTQGRTYFLARFTPEGKELTRYLETHNVRDFTDFVFSEKKDTPAFWWASEVGPDGRVYSVADRNQYAISVFRPDGTLERVIERAYVPWKRTPEEFERIRLLYESAIGGISIPYKLNIEEYEPAISYWHRALRVDEDGRLWVVSSRGIREQDAGTMLTYDVFDRAGHFIKQVGVRCEGDGYNDALFFVGGGHVVLIKGYLDALAAQFGRGTALSGEDEEHAVPEVVCYSIER